MHLLILFLHYYFIQCAPVTPDFSDNWDPNIESNKNALLSKMDIKPHKLPPQSQTQENEDDYEPFRELRNIEKWSNFTYYFGTSVRADIPCPLCKYAVGLAQTAVNNDQPVEAIRANFVSTCVGFEIENEVVCAGLFDVFSPHVIAAIKMTKSGANEICGMFETEICEDTVTDEHQWEVSVPPSIGLKKKREPPKPRKPTLKVLQISDTHLDLEYSEGSNAHCDEPLCCRKKSTILHKKLSVFVPAGKWGMYKCGSPKILVQNMLQNIVKNHPDIDYIMWTGDLLPHNIWQQTKNDSLTYIEESVKLLKNAFPNTTVLPCVGDHEGVPTANFPPPWNRNKNFSIRWLYNKLSSQWQQWLPASEKNSIKHGAFYSVLILPGFRVISLNTNYCNVYSWWLYVNSTDPARQLEWLVDQLQQADLNNERVHIIGHKPPGSADCLKVWSRNYDKIVNRFRYLITAQFFGHSHADEFEVFYSPKNYSKPTNLAYVAPSVSPYFDHNPAYRIYYVDGNHKDSTWEIVDHETWMFDLDKANRRSEEDPVWIKLYSARKAFDMPNLLPAQWNKLLYKMIRDEDLFNKFYRYYHRDSPVSKQLTNKDKLQILCDLKSGKSKVRREICHDLELLIKV